MRLRKPRLYSRHAPAAGSSQPGWRSRRRRGHLAPALQRAQFRGALDVVEITATVTDGRGRFLTGLRASDFAVREDGVPQRLIRVGADREPVSLGLVLDASGSMQGERMNAARAAIHRLLFERSDPRDELFFVEFGFNARLTQEWTSDRQLLRGALQDVQPTGDTALYDAVALAVPTAQAGRHRKKVRARDLRRTRHA